MQVQRKQSLMHSKIKAVHQAQHKAEKHGGKT